jgi:ubiquinone/menaquinone biosynthesis C-methylase UbiE
MVELENAKCCSLSARATCCEPTATCCDEARGERCECQTTSIVAIATAAEVRETVREKYGAAAAADGGGAVCCGPADGGGAVCSGPADASGVFGSSLHAGSGETEPALRGSLGCCVPTAVADLHEGEIVLDLGSGAGADALISARRVGPTGKAIGIDMTEEMLELARRNAIDAGLENVEFRKGHLEELPLADESVDVVISNCAINLSGDKPRVLAEAARVLRPGGRFAVSDVIADPDMDDATRAEIAAWIGCIAGALTESEFREALAAAELAEVEVRATHRVHEHAAAAIIRARKPNQVVGPDVTQDAASTALSVTLDPDCATSLSAPQAKERPPNTFVGATARYRS